MSSSSLGGGYSAVGLDRDLSNFKKRIDANTEEQREHADLMAGLQRKVGHSKSEYSKLWLLKGYQNTGSTKLPI